jgi:CHASE2 domain-containing sensor protein
MTRHCRTFIRRDRRSDVWNFAVVGCINSTSRSELLMPYTRPIRRFYLTPPKLWTFIISLVLAIIAVLAVYGHFAPLHPINGFLTLLIAWIILVAGVLVRGI